MPQQALEESQKEPSDAGKRIFAVAIQPAPALAMTLYPNARLRFFALADAAVTVLGIAAILLLLVRFKPRSAVLPLSLLALSLVAALQIDPEIFERRSNQGSAVQDQNVQERAKYHYYVAKTYAQAGVKDRAIQYIRKSLEEGFKEREKFLKEPEFALLRDDPDFKELMASEQKVL